MAKSRNRNANSKHARNILIVVVFFIVLLVYAVLRFEDYTGRRYGISVGVVWTVGFCATFFFILVYFAQFVLPYRRGESWIEGLNMLINNITSGFAPERPLPTVDIEQDELPRSFAKLNAGILKSHQVLALYRGNSFSRPIGPGFVRLYPVEAIDEVIDLRDHSRSHPLTVHTRDGIPVTSTASVTFRVRRPDHVADDQMPFPYDRDAIFKVSHLSSIELPDRVHPWCNQVAPQAAAYAVSEIARYNFDELPQNMGEINNRITEDLRQLFSVEGIEIVSASAGSPKPPQEISQQKVNNWRAEWEQKIALQAAEGGLEAQRRLRRARARAQVEIIQTIVQSIEEMRTTGQSDLADIVTLRMIEVLEQAMSNSSTKGIVADPLLKNMLQDTALQMRSLLRPPDNSDGTG